MFKEAQTESVVTTVLFLFVKNNNPKICMYESQSITLNI